MFLGSSPMRYDSVYLCAHSSESFKVALYSSIYVRCGFIKEMLQSLGDRSAGRVYVFIMTSPSQGKASRVVELSTASLFISSPQCTGIRHRRTGPQVRVVPKHAFSREFRISSQEAFLGRIEGKSFTKSTR